MKRIAVILLVLIMIFTLVSCGIADIFDPKDNADAGENADISSDIKKEPVVEEKPVKAVVKVDFADDEILSSPDKFEEFIDDDSEFQVKAVFTVNTSVKDFRYFEIASVDVDEDENIIYNMGNELFSTGELTNERPIVIAMSFPGSMPSRGISFTDETGTVRYFAVLMSGKDGSLFMDEFVG
ncbi:MAG: hypothetical protein GX222_01460 [Ruminococcaceae bacterium]|nr:hypothetical protein [Oscillospiraceae bacterium]